MAERACEKADGRRAGAWEKELWHCGFCKGTTCLPFKNDFLFSPVGFKGNLSPYTGNIFFARGLNQMEDARHGRCCQKQSDPMLGYANSPPILEPILVGIGMFAGGTGF